MEFDENHSGDIGNKVRMVIVSVTSHPDIMELKRMMEKLGQAKTHLELKKMITEVDTVGSGTSITCYLSLAILQRHHPLS